MKKYGWILWVLAIIIIIVIILRIFRKRNGTKTDTSTRTDGYTTITDPKLVADNLYERMRGITFPNNQVIVVKYLNGLVKSTDSDFASVWNSFGTRDGDNLLDWIEDELYISSDLKTSIRYRAQLLGLN